MNFAPLYESNDCHTPGGSPQGGEFCSKPGPGGRTTPQTEGEQGLVSHMTAMQTLRGTMMPKPKGLHYNSPEDFVLQHGQFYDSQALTPAEESYLRAVLDVYGRRCAKKQCFYNSQMVLISAHHQGPTVPGMTLEYVEGYTTGFMPIHHGWLALNGKVIDPTLRTDEQPRRNILSHRTVGTFPETTAYYGVPFPFADVLDSVIKRQEGGSLLVDYKRNFPYLTRPYKAAA